MNPRTLAAVVLQISAMLMLASVLATFPPALFSLSLQAGPRFATVRTVEIQLAFGLVVRVAVAVALLAAAEPLARRLVAEHLSRASIGTARLTALALSLVALLLVLDGIETLVGPLYVLATRPAGTDAAYWSSRARDAVVRSVVMIAGGMVVFWRVRILESVQAASAAVRRPPPDE